MGLKDLFSAEGRQQWKLGRLRKKLTQRFGQPEDRERAALQLADIGTDDAVRILLQRFTFTTEKATADQDEKHLIVELLEDIGEKAAPVVREYIEKQIEVAWAVRALRKMQSSEEVNGFIFDYLDGATSEDEEPRKLAEMIKALRKVQDARTVKVVAPLLEDYDDEVRFAAIETLQDAGQAEAREPMLERLVSDEEDSMRVKLRILEALESNGWEVKGYRKAVEEMLPEGWYLDRAGHIKILDQARTDG